jgi:hypothetical protein
MISMIPKAYIIREIFEIYFLFSCILYGVYPDSEIRILYQRYNIRRK